SLVTGHLHGDRLRAHVHGAGAEDLDQVENFASTGRLDQHLDQGKVTDHARLIGEIFDREDVHHLVQVGLDPLRHVPTRLDLESHSADARLVGTTDVERHDVVVSASKQRGDAVEHAGLVLDVGDEGPQNGLGLYGDHWSSPVSNRGLWFVWGWTLASTAA